MLHADPIWWILRKCSCHCEVELPFPGLDKVGSAGPNLSHTADNDAIWSHFDELDLIRGQSGTAKFESPWTIGTWVERGEIPWHSDCAIPHRPNIFMSTCPLCPGQDAGVCCSPCSSWRPGSAVCQDHWWWEKMENEEQIGQELIRNALQLWDTALVEELSWTWRVLCWDAKALLCKNVGNLKEIQRLGSLCWNFSVYLRNTTRVSYELTILIPASLAFFLRMCS